MRIHGEYRPSPYTGSPPLRAFRLAELDAEDGPRPNFVAPSTGHRSTRQVHGALAFAGRREGRVVLRAEPGHLVVQTIFESTRFEFALVDEIRLRIPGIRGGWRSVAIGITLCNTRLMAKAISVRLDDDSERALRILEATGLSRSAAIRTALLASAERVRKRSELASEAAALEADEADRAEMLSIASMMESMRAAG